MDDPMEVDPPLPEQSQETLAYSGICDLSEADVLRILGPLILRHAQTPPALAGYSLCSSGSVATLVWSSTHWTDQARLFGTFPPPSREAPLVESWIRDQLYHLLCWDYVATDLFSMESVLNGWTDSYEPHCTWHVCYNCRPDLLGLEGDHICYGYSVVEALRHIQSEGVPAEFTSVYSCLQKPPSLIYYTPQLNKSWIRSVQPIATLEEALYHLRSHPIGADLIAYSQLFEMGDDIYYGPKAEGAQFLVYHAVIMESVLLYRGEYVAYCKMSNGVDAGDDGYVYVSLNTMFLFLGWDSSLNGLVRPTREPQHLLTNFVFLDMWKPEDFASSSTVYGDIQVPTNKQEEMTGTPLCEEMPASHNLDTTESAGTDTK